MPAIETTSPMSLYTLMTGCCYSITSSVMIKVPSNTMLDILVVIEVLL